MRRFARAARLSIASGVLLISGAVGLLAFSAPASATATLTVTPNTGLSNGSVVSASGSGFVDSSTGGLLECNSDPNQPTIDVIPGDAVPVSCTSPLTDLKTTSSGGLLAASNFTVHTGTIGPPAAGTDSNGNPAATDAALYPCPPTPTEVTNGDVCGLVFGDEGGDEAEAEISFGGTVATTTTTGASTTTTTGATTTTTTGVTTTTATGVTTTTRDSTTTTTTRSASDGGTTTTTAVLAAKIVVDPATSGTKETVLSDGTLAFTGAGPGVWFMAAGGILLVDLGFLLMTMSYRPRELAMIAGRRISRIFGSE
jgi:hypothetical protein